MKKSIILLLISSLFISSCITRQVKKEPNYKETFLGYFISQRGSDIVFIGRGYHYIFQDNSKQIAELTKPKWQSKLKISEIKLRVDKDNNVYGYVNLEMVQPADKISKEDLSLAQKQQFTENSRHILTKKIDLKGIRYEPAIGFDDKASKHFTRKYEAKIMYDITTAEKIAKTALTPVAYVADGILILVGGVYIPCAIIFFTDEDTPQKFMARIKSN